MNFLELYTDLILKNIERHKLGNRDQIFVIQGQVGLFNSESYNHFLADPDTFKTEGDDSIFNKDWFSKTFMSLQQTKDFHLLSFAQFTYLINYIEPSFYIDRVVILKDNLRQLFPISRSKYLEKEDNENIELRPDRLPIYQAEQFAFNDKYYYSIKTPIISFKTVDLFTESKEITLSSDNSLEIIDVSSDPYSLDSFINNCIDENALSKKAVIKLYLKQSLNPAISEILEKLNSLLSDFGGSLYILEESPILSNYKINEKTLELLSRFWGENSTFRNISVYKNPNFGNEITELSSPSPYKVA